MGLDFRIARVKEVYLDWLDQVIRVRDLPGQHNVPGPTSKSMDQIGLELVNLGAGRYARPNDTQYPIFPHCRSYRPRCNPCEGNRILVSHSLCNLCQMLINSRASPQGNADVIESPVKTYARDVKSMVDHAPLSTPAFSRTIRFFSVL